MTRGWTTQFLLDRGEGGAARYSTRSVPSDAQ